ncbi:MAG: MBL fold metallo-hydrolase [Ruminococcaceae bacterium]|nr:MBL fold metallo-hydrolase [Oscillospiraceae bacterium]
MKITVLAENTTTSTDLEAEHGLSLYIETERHNILFDTGQSDLFIKNAEKLGIDLTQADLALISHGHYDHGGGLAHFLELNKTAPVYINKHAFEPHYNGKDKYIGLDTALEDKPRLVFTEDAFKIDEELCLFTCNEKEKSFDLGSFGLNMVQNGRFVPDDFRHEQYLLIKENGKEILISGCSHKGIMDITSWFKPYALVGGFHFSKLPLDETLMEYSKTLQSFGTRFYTCHCTGYEQYEFMKEHIDNLSYISTGDVFEI